MQRIFITGYLAKDPEIRTTPAGIVIATLSIPTSEKWKDKNTGEPREETEWHKVVFFGRQAENAKRFLKKGSLISLEGRLKTQRWNDKDTGIERSSTEISGDYFKMFGERQPKASSEATAAQYTRAKEQSSSDYLDDIPF